jgi:hypothetical protein
MTNLVRTDVVQLDGGVVRTGAERRSLREKLRKENMTLN